MIEDIIRLIKWGKLLLLFEAVDAILSIKRRTSWLTTYFNRVVSVSPFIDSERASIFL